MAYYKVVKTRNTVDVYEYEKPPFQGVKSPRSAYNMTTLQEWSELLERKPDNKIVQNAVKSLEEYEKEKKEKARQYYAYKRKEYLIRLVNNNFDHTSKFLTLTFGENFQDITEANYRHTKFIGKVRRRFPRFKYISVTEFQKRGAIHFHLLHNQFIHHKKIKNMWGEGRGKGFKTYGFIRIKRTDRVKNIGLYMTKYMTKTAQDERLRGKKTYSMSKNMQEPEVLRGESGSKAGDLSRYAHRFYILQNEFSYDSPWQGRIARRSYYIP